MPEPDRFHLWDLSRTLELEAELGGEQEQLRVELFRSRKTPRRFRCRLSHVVLFHGAIDLDEEQDEVELSPMQVLEDITDLLEEADRDFEVDDVDQAEARVLAAIRRRAVEAAWVKA